MKPTHFAHITIPIVADDDEGAERYIRPYTAELQVEHECKVRPASASIIDIEGGTFRVKLREPEKFADDTGKFPLLSDYSFEIIDPDGTAHSLPNRCARLVITFDAKMRAFAPRVELTVEQL